MTLPEYIAANLERPFAWRSHDCVTFASGWVQAATGMNPIASLPAWKDERQALRVIRAVGGIEAAIGTRFKSIHPNAARDGDIGIYERSVCIFSGAHVVAPGIDGLQFIDRTRAKCAWSIFS
ncbi:MAG: DUF6950 family protein [Janthinobacterium lividum]